jgi:hypothetical protein
MKVFTKKYTFLFVFVLAFVLMSFLNLNTVNAEEEKCEKKEVVVIAKDEDGNYVPANFNVYRQIKDVDENPKPGSKVANGKVSSILGRGEVLFADEEGSKYCVELIAPETGESYWIYNQLEIGCGGGDTVTKEMSGIVLILRDMDDNLIRNQVFKVYTQAKDADDRPVKATDRYIGQFNTGEAGEKRFYVPSSPDNIEGEGVDDYVIEIQVENKANFIEYGVDVNPGDITKKEYYISDLKLNFKNYEGVSFPGGTKVTIYKQELDANSKDVLGSVIGTFYTNDDGMIIFQYPEGRYAAKLTGDDGQSHIFWDLDIDEEDRNEYDLKTDSSWVSDLGVCEEEIELEIITEDLSGRSLSNMNFVLYQQLVDADGYPVAGAEVMKGKTGDTGRYLEVFYPNPHYNYALKIYDKNADDGEFWYYHISLRCGSDKIIKKYLPRINFVLRDGGENLLKNKEFSVYTQKIDVDGSPIKEKENLITKLNTSEEGVASLYVAPDHQYNKLKKGVYVFVAVDNKYEYVAYDIQVPSNSDVNFEYIFSDLALQVEDATADPLVNESVKLYEQKLSIQGDISLGNKLEDEKTDSNGEVIINYPPGNFALVLKDDLGQDYVYFDTVIEKGKRNYKVIKTNTTRIRANVPVEYKKDPSIIIYSMKKDSDNYYYRDTKKKTIRIEDVGYYDIMLSPGPYLFVISHNKAEYGKAIYVEDGKLQEVTINIGSSDYIEPSDRFHLKKPESLMSLGDKLKGNILLQVEKNGEAWYVNPVDKRRYYMENGLVAYEMMRSFGLGITNEDLRKIPIGFDARFNEDDSDGDNLSDKMEEALGTSNYSSDSDGDGYDDDLEVRNNFDPRGSGKLPIDNGLVEKLKGKILLQVEKKGQAWYVNPSDGRRYYMQDGDSAYEIMKYLSLGITDENLNKIPVGYID